MLLFSSANYMHDCSMQLPIYSIIIIYIQIYTFCCVLWEAMLHNNAMLILHTLGHVRTMLFIHLLRLFPLGGVPS